METREQFRKTVSSVLRAVGVENQFKEEAVALAKSNPTEARMLAFCRRWKQLTLNRRNPKRIYA